MADEISKHAHSIVDKPTDYSYVDPKYSYITRHLKDFICIDGNIFAVYRMSDPYRGELSLINWNHAKASGVFNGTRYKTPTKPVE